MSFMLSLLSMQTMSWIAIISNEFSFCPSLFVQDIHKYVQVATKHVFEELKLLFGYTLQSLSPL